MAWLTITLIAYFLNAIAMVVDKTLLKRAIKNPFVYTFYIAALGAILMLFVIPFGIAWPGWIQFWVSMLAGATFSIGLFLMFWGLKHEDASRLTPMIGGLSPVFVFILAFFLLEEIFTSKQILAFIIIIIGTFLISLEFKKKKLETRKTLWLALPAALFFAISYVLTKDVYNHQPFLSGFIWTRLGVFITAAIPMIWAKNRYDLTHQKKDRNINKTRFRFLLGQGCGGASAILIQYAISIASVAVVQAIQGTQYIFVFLAVIFLTYKYPRFLKERITTPIIIQKIIAIILISIGIYYII